MRSRALSNVPEIGSDASAGSALDAQTTGAHRTQPHRTREHAQASPTSSASSAALDASAKKRALSGVPQLDGAGTAGAQGRSAKLNLPSIGDSGADQTGDLAAARAAVVIPFPAPKESSVQDDVRGAADVPAQTDTPGAKIEQPQQSSQAPHTTGNLVYPPLDDDPYAGIPSPVDVIAQAKLGLDDDNAEAPQFDFSKLDAASEANGAVERIASEGAAAESDKADGSQASAPATVEADAVDATGDGASAPTPTELVTRGHKRVGDPAGPDVGSQAEAGDAQKKRRPWYKTLLRVVLIVVAAIVAVLVILLAAFSLNRWVLRDDAADIQARWSANGSETYMAIDASSIHLTSDVAYAYTLDTGAKTITFTFAQSQGSGRYWISGDKTTLVIEDGSFDAFTTFTQDIGRAWDEFVLGVQGKKLEFESSDTTTVFTRMSDEQAAAIDAAEAAAVAQAQQDAIADRLARDADGDGFDDETGEAIHVVDLNGDGVDDQTGQNVADIDADGDGILDER